MDTDKFDNFVREHIAEVMAVCTQEGAGQGLTIQEAMGVMSKHLKAAGVAVAFAGNQLKEMLEKDKEDQERSN